jgi:FtsP/CotA-like multicopper oxidase with cupredoxin domain
MIDRVRRRLLAASAAGAALAHAPFVAAQQATKRLRLAATRQSLVGAPHPDTAVWAYNGSVPGPELRLKQGQNLRVEVENALGVGTTIHWHGVRLPNAMDGVPNLTQAPIAPNGGKFVYEFDLPDAGTFWYHPHLGSPEQVGRGLYGALVVEERDPLKVDRDVVWVLSDWRLDREARLVEDFRSPMDASHAGRIGNTVTVNGAIRESFAVRAGERIRLRLINASSARIYAPVFEGHSPRILALDGQPVANWNQRVVLGPGMRADLALDCIAAPGSTHRVIDDFYAKRAYEVLKIDYAADKPIRETFQPLPRLAPNPLSVPDLAKAERHRIVFGGGMMGALPSQREHKGLFWTVNGRPVPEHDHQHEPILSLRRGGSYRIELVNDTAWHHPIHLHGHAFRVLSADHWADSVLLDPRSRAEVAFVADNPGNWMLHCHVLEHQASGMMAVIRVAG